MMKSKLEDVNEKVYEALDIINQQIDVLNKWKVENWEKQETESRLNFKSAMSKLVDNCATTAIRGNRHI
jgi:hypothetical protein